MRGAGWAEVAAALSSLRSDDVVESPDGSRATARIGADGTVHVRVSAGEVLDTTVLRSYCIGAAHMALGWVRSEAICVDGSGEVHDLTMRSLGILRAVDTPPVDVPVMFRMGSKAIDIPAGDANYVVDDQFVLPVEVDPAGNAWVTLRGASDDSIVFGSHLDSVPSGGWLDGVLGVGAAT